jgi:hypothetical protein
LRKPERLEGLPDTGQDHLTPYDQLARHHPRQTQDDYGVKEKVHLLVWKKVHAYALKTVKCVLMRILGRVIESVD